MPPTDMREPLETRRHDASTGPGTSSTVTGLYEARTDHRACWSLWSPKPFYGRGVGYVHEAEKQIPMLEECVAVSAKTPSQLGPCLQLLVNDLFTGRPAPGALEIQSTCSMRNSGADVFYSFGRTRCAGRSRSLSCRATEAPSSVIIAGGGVICANASESLQQLARLLDCPILTTVDGGGHSRDRSPLRR